MTASAPTIPPAMAATGVWRLELELPEASLLPFEDFGD